MSLNIRKPHKVLHCVVILYMQNTAFFAQIILGPGLSLFTGDEKNSIGTFKSSEA
jgi:hypothetical protein